jgi:hypothetical protein
VISERKNLIRKWFLWSVLLFWYAAHAPVELFAAGGVAPVKQGACSGARHGYRWPVVLKGAPELFGARLGHIAAWKFERGRWDRVPIQVDEVNLNGDYVLEHGIPWTAKTGDEIYGTRDELALDGESLGDDFREDAIPLPIADSIAAGWKVSFCSGPKFLGAILLAKTFSRQSEDFGARSVMFTRSPDLVESQIYRYEFNPDSPALIGHVKLRHEDGWITALKDSRFQMPLVLPWWAPDVTLKDRHFVSEIECWRSGPVRTIIAVGVKFRSFLSVLNLHLFSELVFWKNRFDIPTVIEFVFEPGSYMQRGSGLFYSLKLPQPWRLSTNLATLPQLASVAASASAHAVEGETFWASGRSELGAFLVDVRVDPKARSLVPPPWLVEQSMFGDKAMAEQWPWLSGAEGDLGLFLDISGVRKGKYQFGLELLVSTDDDETFSIRRIDSVQWTGVRLASKRL